MAATRANSSRGSARCARGRLRLEIVKRGDDARGFVVLPRRWVVERTFAWLGRCRRLSKDYEATTSSSEAFVKLAMIHLMARRLVKRLKGQVPDDPDQLKDDTVAGAR